MTSANVQMPVLFTIADTDGATLFGEGVTNDLIDNHLEFLLDRSAAFEAPGYDASLATSSLANAFRDTFFVGDPATTAAPQKLFFVNMIAGQGTATVSKKQFTPAGSDARDATASEVVDMFCNKLATAILTLQDNKGLEHVPSLTKKIPIGGRSSVGQTTFDTSVAPTETEKLAVGDIMARVASVHLVGHPLAQAIFANEDEIQTKITTAPPTNANTNPGGVFKSNLAKMLSAAFGGSQQATAAKKLQAGNVFSELVKFSDAGNNAFTAGSNKTNLIPALTTAAPFYYNISGVLATDGVENDALLSLYEQLLAKVVGRSAEMADARGAGYNYTLSNQTLTDDQTGDLTGVSENATKTITCEIPIKAGDKLAVFLRPLLSFKFDTAVVTNANISFCEIVQEGQDAGSVVQILASSAAGAAIQTSDATSSAVSTVFPGYADNVNADDYQASKYGWMGSPNTVNHANKTALRTLSQTTTNTTAVDVMDQHIWKIQVTL
jgi:hypothetical protein|uniref:Uncharacterized protein n=1 Tax=viral metagenome TaxID=1070528 RepID=A0A6C0IPQ0_9ZZZZ